MTKPSYIAEGYIIWIISDKHNRRLDSNVLRSFMSDSHGRYGNEQWSHPEILEERSMFDWDFMCIFCHMQLTDNTMKSFMGWVVCPNEECYFFASITEPTQPTVVTFNEHKSHQ